MLNRIKYGRLLLPHLPAANELNDADNDQFANTTISLLLYGKSTKIMCQRLSIMTNLTLTTAYGSGHKGVAVLLPGFAIKW